MKVASTCFDTKEDNTCNMTKKIYRPKLSLLVHIPTYFCQQQQLEKNSKVKTLRKRKRRARSACRATDSSVHQKPATSKDETSSNMFVLKIICFAICTIDTHYHNWSFFLCLRDDTAVPSCARHITQIHFSVSTTCAHPQIMQQAVDTPTNIENVDGVKGGTLAESEKVIECACDC